MTEQDHFTLEAMKKYGGGFVKLLAQLAHHADPMNFVKIKRTWPEYWEEYQKMGEALKRNKK